LFWVDEKLHHIASSDLDGQNKKILLTSIHYLQRPYGITVFYDRGK